MHNIERIENFKVEKIKENEKTIKIKVSFNIKYCDYITKTWEEANKVFGLDNK